MTEEEKAIEKMYEEGLVNVSKIAEPLINKYKELDYQQCQFVIEYLLADRQCNEEYVDKLEADIDSLEKKNKRYEKYLKNKDEEHNKVLEFIETEKEKLQSDIEIKDEVIEKMGKYIKDYDANVYTGEDNWKDTEQIKQYFYLLCIRKN